jgi:hypothetical protein
MKILSVFFLGVSFSFNAFAGIKTRWTVTIYQSSSPQDDAKIYSKEFVISKLTNGTSVWLKGRTYNVLFPKSGSPEKPSGDFAFMLRQVTSKTAEVFVGVWDRFDLSLDLLKQGRFRSTFTSQHRLIPGESQYVTFTQGDGVTMAASMIEYSIQFNLVSLEACDDKSNCYTSE